MSSSRTPAAFGERDAGRATSSRYPASTPMTATPATAATSTSESDVVREMYRMLGNLTRSFVPATRKRREETSEDRRERKVLKDRLDDEGYDIVEMKENASRPYEPQITEMINRKLSRWAVDGGHGSTVRYSNLVARLRSHPDRPRNLTAILDLLEQLAFTAGPSSTLPEARSAQRQPSVATKSSSDRILGSNDSTPQPAKDRAFGRPSPDIQNRPSTIDTGDTDSAISAAKRAKGDKAAVSPADGPLSAAELQSEGKLPRKALIERWRNRLNQPEVAEQLLLRDVIFILQGINGRFVRFEEEYQLPTLEAGEGAEPEKLLRVVFNEHHEGQIAPPTRRMIHRLAELGRLYRRVSEFSKERTAALTSGLIMQSLCHFISNELTGYYRLIASLEAQMSHGDRGLAAAAPSSSSSEPSTYVTLKRLAVWTEQMTLRMRLMSTIIESCRHAHGGALVSLIHSYTFHGDPFIRQFTSQLLDEVSKPFFHSLSLWIYEGELQDPFDEFFVELNADPSKPAPSANKGGSDSIDMPSFTDLEADAAALWQNKFIFRKQMLPSFLDESFGRKIFSTGKSLNFIRHSCGDSDWVATRDVLGSSGKDLRYTDLEGLERTIDTAFTIASKRLLDIFLDKFKLLDHLRALRDYLMLSKGDFVDLLMQSLSGSLNRPASSLFRHNLTASLETAVRGSNAQFDDPDILRRLDARILEFSAGDTGWDTFTLEYKVDSPVNTVLDTQAMIGYQTIFAHLWKIRRVELALSGSWTRLVSSSNALRRIRNKDATGRELNRESHRAMVMLGEMVQFVRQLQGFCQLEVIEYSWDDLQTFFSRRQGDLDELIQSHRAYLNALIGKVLLRGGKRGAQDYLAGELRGQLDTILAFSIAADDLSHLIIGELARHDIDTASERQPRTGARTRTSSRPQAPVGLNLPPADPAAVPHIAQRLRAQSLMFQERMQLIVTALEKHANLTVRDLGSRLNFNVHYETLRKDSQRRRETSSQGGAATTSGAQQSEGANPPAQEA